MFAIVAGAVFSGPASSQVRPGDNGRPATAQSQARAVQAPSRPSSPDRITLNFKDADIDSVVGAFGHLLNRAFLIDPRVRGKITLETPKPVSRARAFELLQAALRAQGFAVVDTGSLVRVVLESEAKLQSAAVDIGRTPERAGDQVVTQIFRLNYESATNLVPVLRPLIPPNNTITAYPSNNSLLITDYAANLQRLARIIATLDSPSTSEIELVPIKHALAADIAAAAARMVDDATRAGQGAQVDAGQRISIVADTRTNSVMVRSSSLAKMNLAKSLIARLDQPNEQPGNIHVVYLRNAEATRLAQVLRGVLAGESGGAGGVSGSSVGATSAAASAAQSAISSAAGATSPQATAPLASSSSSSGATAFSAGGATIAADSATNSLIITAPDPIYRNLLAVIERLDTRRAQVFIESLIVEVSAKSAAEFGVQWQFLNGLTNDRSRVFGGTNLPARGAGGNILDLIANPLAAGQGLNIGVVKGTISVGGTEIFNLGLLARALESRGNTNILATPTLLTLDNEEARIIIGKNVPFLTGQFTATGTGGASVNPFQTIERKDVGTTLRVKPQISESGTVKLQIFQEVSTVSAEETTAQGIVTNRRAIESNVLVDDGQIVVLGGLIEEKTGGGESKVPGLGNVPILGNLFRYDSRTREKTNLLVFLRPVVIRDANVAHGVTNDRYDYMRQQQSGSRMPPHWALPDFPPTDLAPMPPAPPPESNYQRPQGGPASVSPDVDRAARNPATQPAEPARSEPVPITKSLPTTVSTNLDGKPSN